MTTTKYAFSLRGINLLADLSDEELRAVETACSWRRCSANEQIIDRHSESRDVYFVAEGRVRIVIYSLSGREVTLDDCVAGSHFGELAAIDGKPRSANVMAIEDSLLAALPPDSFFRVVEAHPSVAVHMMKQLARIVRASTERIMDLSTLGANNRVQAEILRLARQNETEENKAVISPIPVHGDIASRVSTTRETVARVLNDLARKNLLERQKDTLLVLDVDALEGLVEEVRGE